MSNDPTRIAAALERLEAEKQRRVKERIEKGETVRVSPLVVGAPDEIDAARAREIAALRKAGETREIVFGDETEVIITGVPRSPRGPTHGADKPDKEEPRRPEGEALRLREGDPLRYVPQAPAPAEIPSDPIPIMVTLRTPDEREPAGVIARGYYRKTPHRVKVYDTEGALFGAADLRPGDDVGAAARKLLKEKCAGTGFHAPLSYSRH
jgi:hypothetical protein